MMTYSDSESDSDTPIPKLQDGGSEEFVSLTSDMTDSGTSKQQLLVPSKNVSSHYNII